MKPEGFMNPISVPVKININHGPMTPRSQNIDNNILASVSGRSSFIDEEPVREPMTRIPESSNQRELYNFAKYQQSSDMKNKNLQLSLNDELPVPAYRSKYSAEVLLQKHEEFVVENVYAKVRHESPGMDIRTDGHQLRHPLQSGGTEDNPSIDTSLLLDPVRGRGVRRRVCFRRHHILRGFVSEYVN